MPSKSNINTTLLRTIPAMVVAILLAATLFTDCKKQEQTDTLLPRLEAIEAISDQYPDSAYTLLSNINPRYITECETKALYYLLSTKASNFGYNTIMPDSCVLMSIQYYQKNNDFVKLAEAYLQNGYRLLNEEKYPMAMISVWEGLEITSKLHNPLMQGRFHQLAGEICLNMNDVTTELYHCKIAMQRYTESCDTPHHDYAIVSYTTSLINNQKYTECLDFIQSEKFWNRNPNPLFQKEIIENQGVCQYELGNYQESIGQLLKATSFRNYPCSAYGLCRLAQAYLILGETDSAAIWLEELHHQYPNEISYFDGKRKYYLAKHDYKNAIIMTDSANNIQYEAIENMLAQQYGQTLSQYFQEKALLTQQLRQRDNLISAIVLAILIIGIIVTILFIRHRIKKNKEMREFLIADILQKNEQINNDRKINESLRSQIEKHLEILTQARSTIEKHETTLNKFAEISDSLFRAKHSLLNKLCIEYYESSDSETSKKLLFNRIKTEIENLGQKKNIKRIEDEVNMVFDNIIKDMRVDFNTLKEVDFIFLSFIKAGFSPRIVCMVCNISLTNFYVKKKRLKERIESFNGPNCKKYISAFDVL